jgi:hypothetical protein
VNKVIPINTISNFINENCLENCNRIEVYPEYADLSFWKDDTDEATLRHVKRIFGPLRVVESSWGDKYLQGEVHVEDYYFKATIYGAYRCEIVEQKQVEVLLDDDEIKYKELELQRLQKELTSGYKVKTITTRKCEPA